MRLIGARVVVAGLSVALLGAVWPVLEAAPAGMTRAAIEEAIAFGATHDPEPYLLRHAGREDNAVVVAAVYTPFLRVAFQAHAAAQRGERLDPSDIAAATAAPLAYIAFRWYCCAPIEAPDLAAVKPQVLMLPEPAPSVAQAGRHVDLFKVMRVGVKPVWSMDGSEALRSFGAEPPFDDIVSVAAYPLESLGALRTFVIYKWLHIRDDEEEVPGPLSGSFRYGVVRAADAARWR